MIPAHQQPAATSALHHLPPPLPPPVGVVVDVEVDDEEDDDDEADAARAAARSTRRRPGAGRGRMPMRAPSAIVRTVIEERCATGRRERDQRDHHDRYSPPNASTDQLVVT